jgi:Methyltransferase FkbM domain
MAGTLEMELSSDNPGDHRVRERVDGTLPESPSFRESSRRTIRIEARTLDDLLGSDSLAAGAQDVQLLWIDVQGHELHVLRGAEALLGRRVPVVMEFWPYGLARAGTEPHDYADFVASRFSWYYNLAEARPERRPTNEIVAMFERYGHNELDYCDLLLYS